MNFCFVAKYWKNSTISRLERYTWVYVQDVLRT
jgi:hypothetical protein